MWKEITPSEAYDLWELGVRNFEVHGPEAGWTGNTVLKYNKDLLLASKAIFLCSCLEHYRVSVE